MIRLIFRNFAAAKIKILMKATLIRILSAIILAIPLVGFGQAEIKRIDPPFWWTGMAENRLQLMVYGEGLGQVQPALSYPGVKMTGYSALENPYYLVIDLEISENARPGKVPISFQYQRELLFVLDYELRARTSGSAERKGFGKEDVIYLIMPDRFSNGDPANDTISGMFEPASHANPDGRHGGDLKGITDLLPYLADLGVTALWLNPVLENNQPAYSYHGYAITDFYRVDPRFGSNEDYLEFVGKAHQEGLKVIMDMVFNHCGSNHLWIQDLPSHDWIHQFPEYTRSNFRAETVMDPYASEFDRTKMMTGWFDKPMPDLNQHNEYLANYLIQNSIWWIEYAGLDGIRMDTYPYSYKDFMTRWMERINKEYPGFSVVGETWLQKEAHTAYWQSGSAAGAGAVTHLDHVTDFPLQYAIKDAFTGEEGWTSGLARIYYVLSQDYLYADPFGNVIFVDNHDLTRFYSSIGENFAKFRMAMAILLTTRGIPMIYYGTEYLMTGEEPKGHGYIRENFPGGKWQSAVGSWQSVAGGEELGIEFLKGLLSWRKTSEVVRNGKLMQFVPDDGIYVYFRYNATESVMVIINKNTTDKALKLYRYQERLEKYSRGKDIITGQEYLLGEDLSIPPETVLILELSH